MNEICWFCKENESQEEYTYNVELTTGGRKGETKVVAVPRCEECAARHKKGHNLSTAMYIAEVVLVAVLLFVFNIDFIYVVLIYLVLRGILTNLSLKIRRKTAEPYKAVCDVYENEEVSDLVEQGYSEKRRF